MEGALHSGLNAACAAAKRLGAVLSPDSPLSQDPDLYDYELPAPEECGEWSCQPPVPITLPSRTWAPLAELSGS